MAEKKYTPKSEPVEFTVPYDDPFRLPPGVETAVIEEVKVQGKWLLLMLSEQRAMGIDNYTYLPEVGREIQWNEYHAGIETAEGIKRYTRDAKGVGASEVEVGVP